MPELRLAVVRVRSPVSDGDAERNSAGEGIILVLELLFKSFSLGFRKRVVGCRCVQVDFGKQVLFRYFHVDFSFVDFDAGVLQRRVLAQGVERELHLVHLNHLKLRLVAGQNADAPGRGLLRYVEQHFQGVFPVLDFALRYEKGFFPRGDGGFRLRYLNRGEGADLDLNLVPAQEVLRELERFSPELEIFDGEDEVPVSLLNGVHRLDNPASIRMKRLFFRGHGHLDSGPVDIDAEIFEQRLFDGESETGLVTRVEYVLRGIRRLPEVSQDE